MNQVRTSSGWRRGTDRQLWVVTGSNPQVTELAAWVRDGVDAEPRRVEQAIPTEVLAGGAYGWHEVERSEVERELCPVPDPDKTLAGILEGLPSRSVEPSPEVLKLPNLGRTTAAKRAELDALRAELLSVVPPLLTRAGQIAGSLARALQDASGYLDEAYGPTFTAWRCDQCAQLVTDDQLEFGWDPGPSMHAIYKPAGEGVGRRQVLAYVECLESTVDGIHGPMRHVLCRVTPEDPDHIDRVASPAATEEVQTG